MTGGLFVGVFRVGVGRLVAASAFSCTSAGLLPTSFCTKKCSASIVRIIIIIIRIVIISRVKLIVSPKLSALA